MSENDFECFASTGVNTPGTMFPNSACRASNFLEADVPLLVRGVSAQLRRRGPPIKKLSC